MPSTSRRRFLAAAGVTGVAGLAGCSAFDSGPPDVNPGTGLDEDTSHALDGDAGDLPDPPATASSVEDADLVLATASADRVRLVRALRGGTPVAFAGDDPQTALRGLLASARGSHTGGMEVVRARPVAVVAAVPRGSTVETHTFVDDGGWTQPVLDPLGWALVGRVPECKTTAPESSADDGFEYAGGATIAGRLATGETYAVRSVASVSEQDAGRFVRLRTTLHAAATGGFAVEEAVREADFPDDQRLRRVWPNAHSRNGVQVANVSDTIRSRFGVEVTPDSDRARAALTGCGGLQTAGDLAYDHRTSVRWKRDGLLGADRRYAEATGRGEWHLDA